MVMIQVHAWMEVLLPLLTASQVASVSPFHQFLSSRLTVVPPLPPPYFRPHQTPSIPASVVDSHYRYYGGIQQLSVPHKAQRPTFICESNILKKIRVKDVNLHCYCNFTKWIGIGRNVYVNNMDFNFYTTVHQLIAVLKIRWLNSCFEN